MRHNALKISITISKDLENFVDYYGRMHGHLSRSAIIQHALNLLRAQELGEAYRNANSEIDNSFDTCSGDGINAEG